MLIREDVVLVIGLVTEALKELLWGGTSTEPVQLARKQIFWTDLEGKELWRLLLLALECAIFIVVVSLPGSLRSVEKTEGSVLALSLELN